MIVLNEIDYPLNEIFFMFIKEEKLIVLSSIDDKKCKYDIDGLFKMLPDEEKTYFVSLLA